MIKILKNTTNSLIVIKDTGISVVANSEYPIPPQDSLLWEASVNIESYVNSGNIVVNDGTMDLNPTNGLSYLRNTYIPFYESSFSSKDVHNAIIEAKNTSSGSSLIPEVTIDPSSPVPGQTWVLKANNGSPLGLLLALTTNTKQYKFSVKTINGEIVRVILT